MAIFVGNENRGTGIINEYGDDLYVTINVNTTGNEIISEIQIFHYVSEDDGFLLKLDYSIENFELVIDGNNTSDFVELDITGKIPQYEPEPEPEPESPNLNQNQNQSQNQRNNRFILVNIPLIRWFFIIVNH